MYISVYQFRKSDVNGSLHHVEIHTTFIYLLGGTSYKLCSKRVYFSGLRYTLYVKVGISLVVVYEREGKSVISVCKRPKRANKLILCL